MDSQADFLETQGVHQSWVDTTKGVDPEPPQKKTNQKSTMVLLSIIIITMYTIYTYL